MPDTQPAFWDELNDEERQQWEGLDDEQREAFPPDCSVDVVRRALANRRQAQAQEAPHGRRRAGAAPINRRADAAAQQYQQRECDDEARRTDVARRAASWNSETSTEREERLRHEERQTNRPANDRWPPKPESPKPTSKPSTRPCSTPPAKPTCSKPLPVSNGPRGTTARFVRPTAFPPRPTF